MGDSIYDIKIAIELMLYIAENITEYKNENITIILAFNVKYLCFSGINTNEHIENKQMI